MVSATAMAYGMESLTESLMESLTEFVMESVMEYAMAYCFLPPHSPPATTCGPGGESGHSTMDRRD